MKKITFDYIIKVLNARPLMIVQDYNIFYLYYLLKGYLNSKNENELAEEELNFKNHFDEWIHNYYNDNSVHNWADILWYKSGGHKEALENFNSLYKEFNEELCNCNCN